MVRRILLAIPLYCLACEIDSPSVWAREEQLSTAELKELVERDEWIVGYQEIFHEPNPELTKYEERGDLKTALVELIAEYRALKPGEWHDDRQVKAYALYLGFARDPRLLSDALAAIREASDLDPPGKLDPRQRAHVILWWALYSTYAILGDFPEAREPIRKILLSSKDHYAITKLLGWEFDWYPVQQAAPSLQSYDWWLGVLRELRKRPEWDNDPEWLKRRHDGKLIDFYIKNWEKGREEYLKAHPEQATGTPGANGGGSQNPPPPVGPDDGQRPPRPGPTTPRDGDRRAAPPEQGEGDDDRLWPLWVALAAIAVAAAILAIRRSRGKAAGGGRAIRTVPHRQ